MASESDIRHVVPNPRLLSTLGTLNILFASCLLLCGLANTAYFALAVPQIEKAMVGLQKKADADQEAKKKAELETLDEREKTAKTDAEKSEIAARRQEIGKRPKASVMIGNMSMRNMGLADPKLKAFVWVDFFTGFALNLLMLASGIGLVIHKVWGLKLGLWVAIAKIFRLILCYGYVAIEIVPPMSVEISKHFAETLRQQQQMTGGTPLPPGLYESLVRIYSIMGVVGCVGMIVVGMIYPLVLLWFLTRPSARAACEVSSKAELPGGLT